MRRVITTFILTQCAFLYSCADNADDQKPIVESKKVYTQISTEAVKGPDDIFDADSAIMALQYYINEARLGSAYAQLSVGETYLNGNLVPQNNIEAFAWLATAESQEITEATPLKEKAWDAMTAEEQKYAKALGGHYISNYGTN